MAAAQAGRARVDGPVAAALRTLQLLGFGVDLFSWRLPHGEVFEPLAAGLPAAMRVALEALCARQVARVARRRPEFSGLSQGFDRQLSLRVIQSGVLEWMLKRR